MVRMSEIKTIEDIRPDDRNANVGTERGQYMVAHSLEQYGAGRSILVDKHGKIVAGNKTHQAAVEMGLDVQIVESDGRSLVVVQRTDLDLDSPEGRAMAIADNRSSEVGLSWDVVNLGGIAAEVDLSGLFFPHELATILEGAGTEIIDANELWKGMPEFEQEDQESFKAIKVHFANQEDYEAFARLVNQTLTPQTKYIWYPYQEKKNLLAYSVEDES